MNEKRLERLYVEFFENQNRLNGYNQTQKSYIYKKSGVKRNREEFKKLLQNPINLENFWKNFHSIIKKSDGSDWLGTLDEFKKKMTEQDVNCLLNSGYGIVRSKEDGEYIWEAGDGDTAYFYDNGEFMYLYTSGKDVRGTWKCSGDKDFTIETKDGERYSSVTKEWVPIDNTNQQKDKQQQNQQQTQTSKSCDKYTNKDITLDDILSGKKILKICDNSDFVTRIQKRLRSYYRKGLGGNYDTKFGPLTKGAVIKFQEKMGLTPDGIVGKDTAKLLFKNVTTTQQQTTPQTTPQPITPEVPQPTNVGLPYTLTGSFVTKKSEPNALDKSHNLKELEKSLDVLLPSFYSKGVNPKITSVDFDILDNGDSYLTKYSVNIDVSDDRKAWVGFTSRGSAGQDYEKRAKGQITGSENQDGKSLEEKLKSIGGGEMEIITVESDTRIPYKQYFVQFTKPEKYPPYTVKESTSNVKTQIKSNLESKKFDSTIMENLITERLDFLLSEMKKTNQLKNIKDFRRSEKFLKEIEELKSIGFLSN